MPNTAERPKAWASSEPLRSVLPASTATTRCTGLVCFVRASMTRGSHAAPSWATITAVTMSGLCVLSGDTFPLAARSGYLPRHAGAPPDVPARLGHALNNTRTGSGRAGRRRKIARDYTERLACGNWLIGWSGEAARVTLTRAYGPDDACVSWGWWGSPEGEGQARRSGQPGAQAPRLRRRRSRSERPPQMPKRSSCSSAYSRHSVRTSQERHTFLASRVEPPFSGKNASGSVWAHSALSCQDIPPASSSPIPKMSSPSGTTSVTAHLLPSRGTPSRCTSSPDGHELHK